MNKKRIFILLGSIQILSLITISITIFTFFFLYHGKIYPNIYINNQSVSGLTLSETESLLNSSLLPPQNINLIYQNEVSDQFTIPFSDIDVEFQNSQTAQKAFSVGRSGSFLADLKTVLLLFKSPTTISPIITISDELLSTHLSAISESISVNPIYPSLKVINNKINFIHGEIGTTIDTKRLHDQIMNSLIQEDSSPITITTLTIDPTINDSQKQIAINRANALLTKTLSLKFEYQNFDYYNNDLIQFISPYGDYNQDYIQEKINLLTNSINRPPQNPTFVFESNKVKEFSPAIAGITLNTTKLSKLLQSSLKELEQTNVDKLSVSIPINESPPDFNTEDVNDLGINELIGRGTSKFKGSIWSRIYNIDLASSRINGTLIKPNEIFSFNKAVGDISKLTGYKEAYIIQDGKTILGDGGGVCQVSTTFFRSALNAGLPIIERRAHSYRVIYYEQDAGPGLDATVYSPTTDLKIKNDTGAHILIQAKADTKNQSLVFELYGTSDGRTSTISKPIITDQSPPPEDLYIDDPSKPAGTIEQIDWKAWGAKTYFDYEVTKDGKILYEKRFFSNFRPWQAKFLRGTGPAI